MIPQPIEIRKNIFLKTTENLSLFDSPATRQRSLFSPRSASLYLVPPPASIQRRFCRSYSLSPSRRVIRAGSRHVPLKVYRYATTKLSLEFRDRASRRSRNRRSFESTVYQLFDDTLRSSKHRLNAQRHGLTSSYKHVA